IGFSELMSRGIYGPIGDSRYVEYVKDINYSGTHLLKLINDILDVSRIEAGQVELDEEEVDIVSAIDTVGRLVSGKAKERSVSIETKIDSNPPLLWADDRRVKQILLNLMTNAVKFTPEGGHITVKAGVNDDGAVLFSVTDSGIGIAPEDILKVMEPFRQADNSLSRKHEGTGLGLPLAKSFVELHGGSLDLKSQVGTGTTVTVTFPDHRSLHVAVGREPQIL
ncbi:MAG: HAMP domain-containing sensor histidine kinase, partial [Alphaproteobacteria bacterium]